LVQYLQEQVGYSRKIFRSYNISDPKVSDLLIFGQMYVIFSQKCLAYLQRLVTFGRFKKWR